MVKGCVNFFMRQPHCIKTHLDSMTRFVTGAFSENDSIAFKFDSSCFCMFNIMYYSRQVPTPANHFGSQYPTKTHIDRTGLISVVIVFFARGQICPPFWRDFFALLTSMTTIDTCCQSPGNNITQLKAFKNICACIHDSSKDKLRLLNLLTNAVLFSMVLQSPKQYNRRRFAYRWSFHVQF